MRDTSWPSDEHDDHDAPWRFGDEDDDDDDYESDSDDDSDDDSDSDYVTCPECGLPIFADASVCPRCGLAITVDTSPWSGRHTWWIWLGLLGIVMTILALLF